MLVSESVQALEKVSLRCVECSALYPGIEAGRPPRYRCACGGVLDVEMTFDRPVNGSAKNFLARTLAQPLEKAAHADIENEDDSTPPIGADWRQLFDERIAGPPIWSLSSDELLLNRS